MTLVTGTVQDLGHDGMEGTLWARPARFRSDGQVVLAPERKPFKITGGVVSAELAPGPAVLELQVGSHARGTFEVVIPEADITLADLLDTVFPWEPAQVSLFVAEREAAQQAKTEAEAAAGQAVTAAQQTGQDRSHVDQVRTELDEAFDESTAGNVLPPRLTETALSATYAPVGNYVTTPQLAAATSGLASSPQGLNFIVTDDPDYAGTNGDVVFRYQNWRDFIDLGQAGLTPLTPRFNTSTRWTAEPGAVRHSPGAAIRTGQSVNSLDAQDDRTDVEIVARVKGLTYGAGFGPSVFVRASGTGPTANAIVLSLHQGGVSAGSYVGGTWSTWYPQINFAIEADRWIWLRLRAEGDQVFLRHWYDGEPEPQAWSGQHTVTQTPLLGPGWAGILAATDTQMEFSTVGLANSGNTAPTEA